MLKYHNDNILGSKPHMVKPSKPYINLDFPSNQKRTFPKEGNTRYINFNETNKSYCEIGEKPNKKNNYSNSYPSSELKLTYNETKETFAPIERNIYRT